MHEASSFSPAAGFIKHLNKGKKRVIKVDKWKKESEEKTEEQWERI